MRLAYPKASNNRLLVGRRRRLDLRSYESLSGYDGLVAIAVDSSGVSVHKCGGWVERLYGKKKRYVKMHFAVDVKTKEVVAVDVTTNDTMA